MDLNQAAKEIHAWSRKKGFWDHEKIRTNYGQGSDGVRSEDNVINPSIDAEKIALMHSELSEALEGLRDNNLYYNNGLKGSVEEELADTIIRILDYAGYMEFDLEAVIAAKREANDKREKRHGRNF